MSDLPRVASPQSFLFFMCVCVQKAVVLLGNDADYTDLHITA